MNSPLNSFEQVSLVRDKGNALSFYGRLVAAVTSDPKGVEDRWTELKLYQTQSGKFVAYSVGKSNRPNEGDIANCEHFDTLDQVADFFKDRGRVTWLSTRMYKAIRKAYPSFAADEWVD